MNGCLKLVPEGCPLHDVSIEGGQGNSGQLHRLIVSCAGAGDDCVLGRRDRFLVLEEKQVNCGSQLACDAPDLMVSRV